MKWIGITGGIASGKSTVTKLLRTLGFEVLDADQISHQVTQVHGPALVQIYKTFGEAVRNPDGSLNRQLLGSMVFGRVAELKKLEAILHPLVREKIAAERARLLARGESAVFYDVPLLYEKQMETDFDAVVLV
ncbi:MAG: dephospho-CoA kinase, partial [Proteobacteria bacterium]